MEQNPQSTRDLPPLGADGVADPVTDPVADPVTDPEAPEAGAGSPYEDMTGEGRILFQVTTAGGAIPLPGAQITVRKHLPDGVVPPDGDTLAVLYSGRDGKTDTLPLPAPTRSLSMEQAPPASPLPFALYNAEAILSGYYRQEYTRIPIFDGVTSIQRVDLVPLPSSSLPDSIGEPRRDINEGVFPLL